MKHKILLLGAALLLLSPARADEGMWLPSLIGKTILKDMQAEGLRLTAEDIYAVNRASLKDAVVLLNGCTGEVVSSEGLVLTNHHCAYGQIQHHSSLEHDYLTNGFTAFSRREELPSHAYSASFLVRMEDVTDRIEAGETEQSIIADATKGTRYRAKVEPFYYGNQYFLFVFEQFDDVRLVCAPPSAIGKFGGDTDNWMWPRHTGDFAFFRIYADSCNNPAPYSPGNVPYKPKRHFEISTKGVKEGDFTFIYGYPARTQEYLHSEAVRYIAEKGNPAKIGLRDVRLEIIKAAMERDPQVRIQYAAKAASVANAWKKWQGETQGIVRLETVKRKQEQEAAFCRWAANRKEYRNVVPHLTEQYRSSEGNTFLRDYLQESVLAIEALKLAGRFEAVPEERRSLLKEEVTLHFKDYDPAIDREIAVRMLEMYRDAIDPENHPEALRTHRDHIAGWVDSLYGASVFLSEEKLTELLDNEPDQIARMVLRDGLFQLWSVFNTIRQKSDERYAAVNDSLNVLYKSYLKGLMEMQPERLFYPDANSTLRVAYGKVSGFVPADGIIYEPLTTLDGVIAKDDPAIYDYNVPEKLRRLWREKDYGRWAVNGTVPVCFLASNHTTGGNSGSPIIDGDGRLVGINFDRCWESTMSDVIYDPAHCRNIAVDIRYVLFLTEKVCDAPHLIEEMSFSRK